MGKRRSPGFGTSGVENMDLLELVTRFEVELSQPGMKDSDREATLREGMLEAYKLGRS